MSTTRIRPRTLAVLAAFAGLMAVVAVTIPSSGAAAPGFVRLNLGSDGRYFEYGTTQQTLTPAKNGCQITSAEPLIDLSSTGTQSQPGLGPDGIGVKQSPSSGNGTPCTQVEPVETLTLKASTAAGNPLTGKRFSGVRLDLEMTGNAVVMLTFSRGAQSETYQLQTGTSIEPDELATADLDAPYVVDTDADGDKKYACAAPNSSGPNSGSNDNCQWRVDGSFDFDAITLTTTLGTVSLEGGGDFGTGSDFDTLLYLANTAPTAVADSFTTNEDTAVSGNVLTNDTDADGNGLSAALVSGPSNGTLTSPLAAGGDFTYTPAANWSGTDSFVYSASDGKATSNATVTITVAAVDDPPVAVSGTASTPEDTSVTVTVATDVDSVALTSTCSSTAGGTITDNGNGTVSFLPPLDFNGTVTLTCTASDGTSTTSSSATITVGVDAVNDAPVAVDDTDDVDEDSSVDVPVLANDSDGDGDALSVRVADITAVSPVGATALPNADGTVTFTPPAGYTGAGSFSYRAFDGALSSNLATVQVAVVPVMCSLDTVTDTDGDVTGSFTRLSDPFECKRYTLEASVEDGTVLFQPSGTSNVKYRGEVSFGPDPAPAAGGTGIYPLRVRYDPTGGTDYRPMQWCIDPQFDANQDVMSATLPAGESWCVASAYTRGDAAGNLVTFWQVYGEDDPRMTR